MGNGILFIPFSFVLSKSTSADDAFSDNSDALMTSDVDYLPISAEGDVEDDDDLPNYSHANGGVTTTNTSAAVTHDSANPLFSDLNGSVSALDLNGDGRYDEGFEEEEERAREREEDLMQRAFVEDERRRNAPLTTENAVRVMDAMRGISFLGFPPDWAGRVSEDRWIGHLSRLRTTEDQSSATDTSPPNATPEVR